MVNITYIVRSKRYQDNASKSLNPTSVTAGNSVKHNHGPRSSSIAVLFSALPSKNTCQDIINECDLAIASL